MRSIIAIAILTVAATRTAAADDCTTPAGVDQLPAGLVKARRLVGEPTLAVGASVTVGALKLSLAKRFMPALMGSKVGDWFTDLTGATGTLHETTTAPGVLRVGPYRVTARAVNGGFALRVEEGGCAPELEAQPLAAGASRLVWLSTEGTTAVRLFAGERYFSSDYFEMNLYSGFNRNGRYTAYMNIYAVRNRAQATVDLSDLPAKVATLDDMRLEVVRVVWGGKTRLEQGEILPVEADPVAHVLVRVSRP